MKSKTIHTNQNVVTYSSFKGKNFECVANCNIWVKQLKKRMFHSGLREEWNYLKNNKEANMERIQKLIHLMSQWQCRECLCQAIEMNDLTKVTLFLEKMNEFKMNEFSADYKGILNHALNLMKESDDRIINLILKSSEDLMVSNSDVLFAIGRNKMNLFKLLSKHSYQKFAEWTVYSCKVGNIECFEYCMSNMSNSEKKDLYCLRNAVFHGRLEMIEYLLDSTKGGKQILDENSNGLLTYLIKNFGQRSSTPSLAGYDRYQGQIEVLKYLIERFGIEDFSKDQFYELLFQIPSKGNVENLKYFVEKLSRKILNTEQVDLDKEIGNKTLIWNATFHGQFEMVEYLLEKNSSLLSQKSIETLSFLAVEKNHWKILKLLFIDRKQTRIDVNQSNHEGKSLLFVASEKGNLETVKMLLEYNEILLEKRNTHKSQTALYAACISGNLEVVKLLVENGAIVDKADRSGNTPLMISSRSLKITQYLISKGADVNSTNKQLKTPLMFAVGTKNAETAKLLISHECDLNVVDIHGKSALMIAASQGNVPALNYLIEGGVDLRPEKSETSALMISCQMGKLDAIKLLIEKGCDVNETSFRGNTPLHIAVSFSQLEVFKFLIQNGGDIARQNVDGETPFFFVIMSHIAMPFMKLFTSNPKFNINSTRYDGKTPLHVAISYHRAFSTIRYLVEVLGANLNAQDSNGETPLFFAFKIGNLELVNYLIERGSDSQLRNKKGETYLESIVKKH